MHHILEYQNWGWNPQTFGAVLTVLFTFMEAVLLLRQSRTLWRDDAAMQDSLKAAQVPLSNGWLTYFCCVFTAFVLYGLEQRSVAMTFNGLLAAAHLPILYWLWRYKKFNVAKRGLAVMLGLALVAMAILPYRPYFFMVFSFGAVFSIALQPLEMFWRKSSRNVGLGLLVVYFLARTYLKNA